ncbi:hypothetical protein WH95_20110 [Kiloniella litopenaei]|uniref:Transposase n=1 Tax=Kiloniella litopenaei TaxID=1549748 RepID=A0A0M2R6I8_9PROT|nr:hypothetical protein [Kiloniella litopenaei]KKJ75118.1 hypothetical protein WH95_20110 [Kiloniella litopenaei]
MARFDLSAAEWLIIEPLLPRKGRGPARRDDRIILKVSSISCVQAHRAAAGSKKGNWRKVLAAHAEAGQVRFTRP